MAGLIPGVEGIDPQTTSGSLLVPFLLSGIGIGFAVAPVTSAVMATAPKDRVGNASGVLSTTRQVGSLMGIAILGAVLQNQVTANITEGVQAVSQIPDAVKQRIIAAAASGSMQMGAPGVGSGLPATAQAMIGSLFKGWFTEAIASAFIVAVVLAVIGAFCALLLSSHVKEAQDDEAAAPVPSPHRGAVAFSDNTGAAARRLGQGEASPSGE
jgi:MFS-type transporter involved in bile tolerance (Atg22 family)